MNKKKAVLLMMLLMLAAMLSGCSRTEIDTLNIVSGVDV